MDSFLAPFLQMKSTQPNLLVLIRHEMGDKFVTQL
jgi:pyruvate-formate lyase